MRANDLVVDAGRLDRIEEKIDKLSDAMISLARAEERLVAIEANHGQQYERINKMSTRIDVIEREMQEAKMTTGAVNKLFWVILVGVVGAAGAAYFK